MTGESIHFISEIHKLIYYSDYIIRIIIIWSSKSAIQQN